jgi:hypothetical protein
MYRLWIKKVYIKSPVIGSDRNPLVTHADFDNISPVVGNIMTNTIMKCIEHVTCDGYSKDQKGLPQNSKYWQACIQYYLKLYNVQMVISDATYGILEF